MKHRGIKLALLFFFVIVESYGQFATVTDAENYLIGRWQAGIETPTDQGLLVQLLAGAAAQQVNSSLELHSDHTATYIPSKLVDSQQKQTYGTWSVNIDSNGNYFMELDVSYGSITMRSIFQFDASDNLVDSYGARYKKN